MRKMWSECFKYAQGGFYLTCVKAHSKSTCRDIHDNSIRNARVKLGLPPEFQPSLLLKWPRVTMRLRESNVYVLI